jgi:hypothetical protein
LPYVLPLECYITVPGTFLTAPRIYSDTITEESAVTRLRHGIRHVSLTKIMHAIREELLETEFLVGPASSLCKIGSRPAEENEL